MHYRPGFNQTQQENSLKSAYARAELKNQYEQIQKDEQGLYNKVELQKKRCKSPGVLRRCAIYLVLGAAAIGGSSAAGIVKWDEVRNFYSRIKLVDSAYKRVKPFVGRSSSAKNETLDKKVQGGK